MDEMERKGPKPSFTVQTHIHDMEDLKVEVRSFHEPEFAVLKLNISNAVGGADHCIDVFFRSMSDVALFRSRLTRAVSEALNFWVEGQES